jgi:hypothetical protein
MIWASLISYPALPGVTGCIKILNAQNDDQTPRKSKYIFGIIHMSTLRGQSACPKWQVGTNFVYSFAFNSNSEAAATAAADIKRCNAVIAV